jgi:hypothetical protein
MWHRAVLLFLPAIAFAQKPAGSWQISNPSIEVTLRADGALDVFDRSSGGHWNGVAPAVSLAPQHVVLQQGRSMEWQVEMAGMKLRCKLSLAAAEPGFDLTLSAPPDAPLPAALQYPPALVAPGGEYRLVLPHQAGLLYTVQDAATNEKFTAQYPVHSGNGLSMPWVGVTDLERGLMTIIETPEGSGVTPRVQTAGANRVFAPQVYWQASRDTFRFDRALHYRLFARGGYVAMCKYYRNRLISAGRFVTLRDKQKARPQLSKLIGTIDLHMRGQNEDQIETVKYLESKGVKRMLINSDASPQNLGWMRERGYLVGSYRIYTDIYPQRPGARDEVTRGYPQDGYALKDGSPTRGFGYSDSRKSTYRCSVLQLPLMQELIPPLVREKRYEAIFLDVVTSGGARDCYNPAHPLDRIQDRNKKIELLRYTTSLGLVTGSEDGADWAAPYLDYFEGMTMTRRFGYVRGVTVNTWPGKFDVDEEYKQINLNERVRAPLWDLVFHDSVVSTWRWNFTPDRYSDSKWWTKHDLMYMIGGDMPIFMVNRSHLEANGDRIAQSYRDVSEWNARIGWDELVNHRALTPDRSVQESQFSSGWAIAVNFSSDQPYAGKEGPIAPWSYKIYRWRP